MNIDELIINDLRADLLGGSIIPLDKRAEYISLGIYTARFADYFLSAQYAHDSTDLFEWDIKRADNLINLRIWIRK